MYLPVALALLILLASHGGYAYPGGPPTSICNTSPAEMFLRPGASHGNPQNGNGGFLISTDLPVSAGNGTGGYDYEAGELYTGRIVYLSRFLLFFCFFLLIACYKSI